MSALALRRPRGSEHGDTRGHVVGLRVERRVLAVIRSF
jgi:hypothetical protein